MRVSLAVCLPRDAQSVSTVRHLCRLALEKLGAAPDAVSDIEIAVSETCTNVLRHSQGQQEYEVWVGITDESCEVIVIDVTGSDFGYDELRVKPAVVDSDGGRGIHLIRALMDVAQFSFDPQGGAAVRLVKRLSPQPSGKGFA